MQPNLVQGPEIQTNPLKRKHSDDEKEVKEESSNNSAVQRRCDCRKPGRKETSISNARYSPSHDRGRVEDEEEELTKTRKRRNFGLRRAPRGRSFVPEFLNHSFQCFHPLPAPRPNQTALPAMRVTKPRRIGCTRPVPALSISLLQRPPDSDHAS
ncbi:hypothetical protein FA13DRAFT_1714417 [Coprinellus micaceus]|uniref:Uncharacterized protein n=1 Tax=Coprinellus micaceus TaxID=71717 RepID=A0A4Y7SSJ1_COPMI|nr:hypothetical protein FA13DRAFT_1714417 [Coprinellus micaceus]